MSWAEVLDVRERIAIVGCVMRVIRADGVISLQEIRALEALMRCLRLSHENLPVEDFGAERSGAEKSEASGEREGIRPSHTKDWDQLAEVYTYLELSKLRVLVRRIAYATAAWASTVDGFLAAKELEELQSLRLQLGLDDSSGVHPLEPGQVSALEPTHVAGIFDEVLARLSVELASRSGGRGELQ